MFLRFLALISLVVLISGCVSQPKPAPILISDHCYKDAPLFFAPETKVYLEQNDEEFLRDLVIHNETYERLCG